MQWDNSRVCCYNERDAARVSADLERADSVRFDLQKSVFDGFWLRGVREEGVDTGRDVWFEVVRSSRSTDGVMRWTGLVERNYYWSSRRTSGPWNPWTAAFGGVLVGGVGVGGLVWSAAGDPFSHSFEMDWSSTAQTQE